MKLKIKISLSFLFALILNQAIAQNEVFQVVEQMPRFAGCEHIEDEQEKSDCAIDTLLNYIGQNLVYPKKARKKGIEGIVVVSFIVEKNGEITGVKVIREIGGGCGKEVKRLCEAMPVWIPGVQRGENIRVQFNLPVRFRLE